MCILPSGETKTFYVGFQAVPNAKAPGILQAIVVTMDNIDNHWNEGQVNLNWY